MKIYVAEFCAIFNCKEVDYWKYLQQSLDLLCFNRWSGVLMLRSLWYMRQLAAEKFKNI